MYNTHTVVISQCIVIVFYLLVFIVNQVTRTFTVRQIISDFNDFLDITSFTLYSMMHK